MRWGKMTRLVLLTGCCLVLTAWQVAADNWPRFRGPNGNGTVTDKNIPIQWSDKNGLFWKTLIPGSGNSSPVIWGNHIFLQSATNDGKERMLLCVSASDGKILWSRNAPGAPFKTLNKRNTYASSTPATDGERVYTIFWDGSGETVHAYDFKGTLLWQYNLGPFASQHGAGSSPIVHDGKVFINHDQDGAAEVVALDAKTGKTAWTAQREGVRTCYSVPFVLERPGEPTALIIASTPGITAYNPADGAELWSHDWKFTGMRLRTVGSPLFHEGMIFAASGDGSGARHMIGIQAGSKSNGNKTRLVWESQDKALLPYVPTILVRGDHIYIIHDISGTVSCVEAKTGKVVWSERAVGPIASSPILVDGKIYAINEAGEVFVIAAEPTGYKQLARNALGEPSRSSPAVADGKLFIRGATHLYCIGKK